MLEILQKPTQKCFTLLSFLILYVASHLYTCLDRTLWLQEDEAPRTSRQSANVGGKVVSLTHQLLLPPGDIPGTHFCYRVSRHQGYSGLEGSSMTYPP